MRTFLSVGLSLIFVFGVLSYNFDTFTTRVKYRYKYSILLGKKKIYE